MNIDLSEYKRLRAYSNDEFWKILDDNPDLDLSDYRLCQTIGIYEGVLIIKKWGQKRNIICYVDCTEKNDRKIKCTAFQDKNYLGLADIPMGTRIRLYYDRSVASNKIRLANVEIVEELS